MYKVYTRNVHAHLTFNVNQCAVNRQWIDVQRYMSIYMNCMVGLLNKNSSMLTHITVQTLHSDNSHLMMQWWVYKQFVNPLTAKTCRLPYLSECVWTAHLTLTLCPCKKKKKLMPKFPNHSFFPHFLLRHNKAIKFFVLVVSNKDMSEWIMN